MCISNLSNSTTLTPHPREVEAVTADVGKLGQARLVVRAAEGVPQNVVDLLGRPLPPVLRVDSVLGTDQRDEGGVGGVAVAVVCVWEGDIVLVSVGWA